MLTSMPSTLRLRARLVALFAVLVAFDVAFVAALYVLAHVALGLAPLLAYDVDGLFWSMSFDIVPLWLVLVVGTPLTLVLQSVFGYRQTLQDVARGDIGPDKNLKNVVLADRSPPEAEPEETVVAAPALRDRVARLAQTAGVEPPRVSVVDSETPNSYVAGSFGERTLFATTGLLAALNDDELDAVLGHELAHLANGDAFVMTAAAFVPTVTEQFITGTLTALRHSGVVNLLADVDSGDKSTVPQFDILLFIFSAVALPMAGILYIASTACYRLLSRIREYAADAGGVAITGSPAALADALETLTHDARPDRDLRTARTGVRELCVLPYAIDEREETAEDALGRARQRWEDACDRLLPGSHPDPDERIAALRERQADLSGAS